MPLARFLALAVTMFCAFAAHADPLDDALAKFAADNFSQTEKAIGELAASGAPNAAALLEALADNRMLIDPASRMVFYRNAAGETFNAKSGEKLKPDDAAAFKKVRVNNGLRSAIQAAMGLLTLSSADPLKRIDAAQAAYKARDSKALPGIEAALAKESDPKVAKAFAQARAAILIASGEASPNERLGAVATLKQRGDQAALSLLSDVEQKTEDATLKAAAHNALASIQTARAWWDVVQNIWFGISAASVLLLAAIGLAITFGVMGVINMAHGEMVMLGAYCTYIVQGLLPPSLQEWSLLFAIPAAFLVAGAVGILIERSVIRFLYTRPLETLLATWGVSLILQQAVRSLFGANNREVKAPQFMSGSMDIGGLSIGSGRLWIIGLAIAVFLALQLLLRMTSFGLRMRAVTQNRRMAASMGISTGRIDMLAFGLGSGIAGIAGVALSQIDNVSPNLGQGYIIDSFMVVVLGGVGNLWGTLLGALSLGLANKLLEPLIGAVQGQIALLVFIILFIQMRPRGLFALKGRAVEA